MRRRNAFTLVELLAVIIVLAIISLLAGTAISNIIKTTRTNVFISTFDNVVDRVKKNIDLDIGIDAILCDDDTSIDTCSSKYEISKKDYKMKVKKVDADSNKIYVSLAPKPGSELENIDLSKANYSSNYSSLANTSLSIIFDISDGSTSSLDIEKDIVENMHSSNTLNIAGTSIPSRNRFTYVERLCSYSVEEDLNEYNINIYKDYNIDNNNMILPYEYTVTNLITILKNDKDKKYKDYIDNKACYDMQDGRIYKCLKGGVESSLNSNSSYVKSRCYGY